MRAGPEIARRIAAMEPGGLRHLCQAVFRRAELDRERLRLMISCHELSRLLGWNGVGTFKRGAQQPGRVATKVHTLETADRMIGEGGLVITMFDYYRMIGDYQAMLQQFLSSLSRTCVLFVGYAFMDMDIGAEIYRIRKENTDVPWYAVFPRDDADVRAMYFQQFGIRQINRTAHNFVADLDDAVDFLPAAWKLDRLDALQDKNIIQRRPVELVSA